VKAAQNEKNTLVTRLVAVVLPAVVAATALALPNNLLSWKPLIGNGAEVETSLIPNTPTLDEQHTNALRIAVKRVGLRAGIVCTDMEKTKLPPGQWYDLAFSARTDTRKTFALTVSLESSDGKTVCARTTLPEVGGTNWAPYRVALNVHQPASRYRMVIGLADTGTIWLNGITLTLRPGTNQNQH
jgi:hypothetical protein